MKKKLFDTPSICAIFLVYSVATAGAYNTERMRKLYCDQLEKENPEKFEKKVEGFKGSAERFLPKSFGDPCR